ncbi:MAG: RNA polymerase sigma factor [Planctomycetota bacterium]
MTPATNIARATPAAAAAALYRAHGQALRAYLRARLGDDPGAVEDLCQETFLAALRDGLPPGPAGPWLFGIARNKALKHRRDARPPRPLEREPETTSADPLDQAEQRARVRRAVAALPEDLRETIALRYEGGLGYAEIAARLELPLSTVQGRLKRARVALRAALLEEEPS